jgi:hypothetical protein
MPYSITWEPNGALVRLYGHCTGQDVANAIRDMHNHHDFDDLRFVIHDALDCQSLTFSENEPEMLAAADLGAGFSNGDVCIAVAATQPDVLRFLGAYQCAQVSPYPSRLFNHLTEARAWVGQMLKQRC